MIGTEWPDEIEMLSNLSAWGWTLYGFGHREHPEVIAAVQRFASIADVMIFRGPDRAAAYRTVTSAANSDPLRAEEVVWVWIGHAKMAMVRMISLRLDADCGKPAPIPDECCVPELERRPITVIPPRFPPPNSPPSVPPSALNAAPTGRHARLCTYC